MRLQRRALLAFLLVAGGGLGAGAAPRRCGAVRPADRQRDRLREHQARQSRERMGRQRLRVGVDPGLRHEHRRRPGRDGLVQGRHPVDGLPDRHLPDGLLRRLGRAQDHHDPAVGEPAAEPAGLPDDGVDRPDRLRQLGRLGELGGPGGRGLRHLPGQARARGRDGRLQPHGLRRARRRRRLRAAVPDLRHDLAGLQPVRRQLALRRQPRRARLQGELQPAVHHARDGRGGLGVQRRVPDGPLAGAQRLRRLVHDRRRHRPAPRRAARARDVHVRGPRRVLVGRPARERRGGARRRREPRLLQRERDLLEDALGEQPPDARHLQGDARERQDRPRAADLDGHVARPALQPARRRRAARERAVGPALPGQRRRHDRDPGPGRRREDALLAQHDDRDPGRGGDRDAARRDARLRVGRGHRQRVPARPGRSGSPRRRSPAPRR